MKSAAAAKASLATEAMARREKEEYEQRATLCLPEYDRDAMTHSGTTAFRECLERSYRVEENNALERLVKLKTRLRDSSTHDFWGLLMEELCDVTDAQCGFVAKRMLVDDQNAAVEMPELGEPGSCLMGVAFYVNNGVDVKDMHQEYKFHAYGKAYLGVPLWYEGKNFAHFGMMWSLEGSKKRKLGWGFIEMLMHSLEDLILQRMIEGRGFAKDVSCCAKPAETSVSVVIPNEAIAASQSVKPYARSLSHELRTPMHGVIGMLDIMYANVIDAIQGQASKEVRAIFEDLKKSIEVVQDSSKRAVEAADNVMHAYDLNMQMPDTPLQVTPLQADSETESSSRVFSEPHSAVTSQTDSADYFTTQPASASSPVPTSNKRQRSGESEANPGSPPKRMALKADGTPSRPAMMTRKHSSTMTPRRGPTTPLLTTSEVITGDKESDDAVTPTSPSSTHSQYSNKVRTRDFLLTIVNEALQSWHPTSKVHTSFGQGDIIKVEGLGSSGQPREQIIHLAIDRNVPETITTDEEHLQFALRKLVDNAIKFTEEGTITLSVAMATASASASVAHIIEIRVIDTGCGITEDAKAHLFQPHFQEDAAISRHRDGLGLSLFNAKAHVRMTLGGDMTLERSETGGPLKGSEFLVRLPISPSSTAGAAMTTLSRPNSPPLLMTRTGSSLRAHTCSPAPSTAAVAGVDGSSSSNSRDLPPAASMREKIERISRSLSLQRSSSSSSSSSSSNNNNNNIEKINPPTGGAPSPHQHQHQQPPPARPAIARPKVMRPAFNKNLARQHPLRILVAEDNAINRNILLGYLRRLGYDAERDVTMACDGAEAVAAYAAALRGPPAGRIDVVLMDLWMPNMDGYEAAERILALARGHRRRTDGGDGEEAQRLAVVAVTADITSPSQERARRAGMCGFVAKPYKVLDIQKVLVEKSRFARAGREGIGGAAVLPPPPPAGGAGAAGAAAAPAAANANAKTSAPGIVA